MRLISTVLLSAALVANASPTVINRSPITLPVSKRLNPRLAKGETTLLKHDQARAAALKARGSGSKAKGSLSKRDVVNEQVINAATVYIATVNVGDPPTEFDLLIDTGSSNTWVGAGTTYVQTPTSIFAHDIVEVIYGSGDFLGVEFLDQVTIAPGLTIHNQSIGVAVESDDFEGVDGILGIGPSDLTVGTLIPDAGTAIPTVTDNLFAQGTIPNNEIGVFFAPTTTVEIANGEITWGGIDTSKINGTVSFAPISTVQPAASFWGIAQTITYGSTTIIDSPGGIVDTGTTLVLLATPAYNAYVAATGAVLDPVTGLLRLTNAQFANLQPLIFNINGVSYEFTPNAQLWPRSLNTAIGGRANNIYLIVADLGMPEGEGFDFVNGYTFLERFYSVYDSANQQVGFAPTFETFATTN